MVSTLLDIQLSFYIFSLACLCAEKARENGYDAFALQFYGECWSGDNAKVRYAMFAAAKDDKCIMSDFGACDINSEEECVGKQKTNYVYVLEEGISFDTCFTLLPEHLRKNLLIYAKMLHIISHHFSIFFFQKITFFLNE